MDLPTDEDLERAQDTINRSYIIYQDEVDLVVVALEFAKIRAEERAKLKTELDQLERLAEEYTKRFMPAYMELKVRANEALLCDDLPDKLRAACHRILST